VRADEAMTDAPTRRGRGLAVVIALALLFFALLALIILKTGGKPDPQTAPVSETLTVLPARIRIRTEPKASAPVVAQAKSGEQVKLLEDRGAWVRVETGEGLSGWAERAYLERTAECERRLARYKAIRALPPLKGVPAYPPAARRAGIAGPVVVRGIVRRDGTIDNVEIIRDLPYGLGESARRAVSRWRFRPATFAGEPIDVYYTVTVNFKLQ